MGKFSFWLRQPAQPVFTQHHRRYRHRRFRVPPEALGQGYEHFDVDLNWSQGPSLPTDVTATKSEPGPYSEREFAHAISRRGLKFCAGLLLLILVCLNFRLVMALCLEAARAWPHLFR